MAFNSIINLVLEKRSADPATFNQGRIYYNTTSNLVRYADGTAWNDLGATLTAQEILAQIITVAGAGSGLDADTVDGLEASALALANHTHTANQITDLPAVIDARIMAAFTNDAVDATVDTIAEFTQLIKDNEGAITAVLSIKRHDQLFGNGSDQSFPIVHGLNTVIPMIQIIEEATGETVLANHVRTDLNTVTISVDTPAPAADQYRAIILA